MIMFSCGMGIKATKNAFANINIGKGVFSAILKC